MQEFLNHSLFTLGDYTLKVSSLIKLGVFILIWLVFLKLIKKAINNTKHIDKAKKYSIYTLLKYFFLVVFGIMSLQIIGFNMSVLLAGSAALLVGVGIGIQNLFNDYISGIIILIDSSVKVDDVLEVNGLVCRVQEINLRTTKVLTRDDKYIILPNSDLTRHQLINWSHSDIASRFEVVVGVAYASDITVVTKLMKEAAAEQDGVLKTPQPFTRFNDFGESALIFSIHFWSEDLFRVENIRSELRTKILEKFRKNSITIPFPQRDIHTKS